MIHELNFPKYSFLFEENKNGINIFDSIRKKYVKLTPEEWVRQNLIQYLVKEKNYPPSLIGVEKQLKINNMKKRFDIVVFNRNGEAYLLAECKAPSIDISEATFDQAAMYNIVLRAKYFVISNGIEHYSCRIDFEQKKYVFLTEIPENNTLNRY